MHTIDQRRSVKADLGTHNLPAQALSHKRKILPTDTSFHLIIYHVTYPNKAKKAHTQLSGPILFIISFIQNISTQQIIILHFVS